MKSCAQRQTARLKVFSITTTSARFIRLQSLSGVLDLRCRHDQSRKRHDGKGLFLV